MLKVNQLPTQTETYNLLVYRTPALERRDSRSVEYTDGRVNICAVPFNMNTGDSMFRVRHWESREALLLVDDGSRTHDPKTHGPSTTPFAKELGGITVVR